MAKAKDSKAFTLADEIVTKYAATDPIVATMLGVPEYADRMPDFSTEMIATQAAIFADGVKQAQGIETFNEVDRIARDVIVDRAAALARIHESGEVARAFSVLSSPVGNIRQLFEIVDLEGPNAVDNVRKRLDQTRASLDTWKETVRGLAAAGTLPAKRHVIGVADQAQQHAGGGYLDVAKRIAAKTGVDVETSGLAKGAESASSALSDLSAFLHDIAEKATDEERCGHERYGVWSEYFNGAQLDFDEAYWWGYEDLQRINARMEELRKQLVPSSTSLRTAAEALDADPERIVVGEEAIVERLRGICDGAVEKLNGKHFDIDPRIQFCDARIAPEGSASAPYYMEPSEDLSRPGTTWLPTLGRNEFPLWRLVSTWYHESIPGHHLQLGTSVLSTSTQSRFHRSLATNSGYCEGWALYAERLMDELGFFEDPADEYGFLSGQSLRAARVVVDIGMHLALRAPSDLGTLGALGDCSGEVWSPEMAVALLEERAILVSEDARSEVDRYLGNPGQAISYKMGERAWLAARAEAQNRLGSKFDLKAFHGHALSLGSLGLAHLGNELARWPG